MSRRRVHCQGYPSATTQGTVPVTVTYEQGPLEGEYYGVETAGGAGPSQDARVNALPGFAITFELENFFDLVPQYVKPPPGFPNPIQGLEIIELGRVTDRKWTVPGPVLGVTKILYFQFEQSSSYYRLLINAPSPAPDDVPPQPNPDPPPFGRAYDLAGRNDGYRAHYRRI